MPLKKSFSFSFRKGKVRRDQPPVRNDQNERSNDNLVELRSERTNLRALQLSKHSASTPSGLINELVNNDKFIKNALKVDNPRISKSYTDMVNCNSESANLNNNTQDVFTRISSNDEMCLVSGERLSTSLSALTPRTKRSCEVSSFLIINSIVDYDYQLLVFLMLEKASLQHYFFFIIIVVNPSTI